MATTGAKKIVAWVVCILLAGFFLMSAYPKLTQGADMVGAFEKWGYSKGFMTLIGVMEALGALLLLWPKSAFYGAGVLIVLMLGATYTHLSTGIGDPWFALGALAVAAVAGWLRLRDALFIGG